MFEIIVVVLVALLGFGINEGMKWYASDDRQLPLSTWSKEQLDTAFARSTLDREKFEQRGTMSSKEYIDLMERRNREVVAELKRRGVYPDQS